ncbi:MAG: 16S rRNA (adenine(1518)-N(6)/adenine(1519)-N(6))-dimethyltransferase RsmA [Candidatus Brocadiia bacterium]|jgi:16S rRNA (adenine1518-N6/adenine1519-N6)-dimethyltransferase|nr:16S rRNA (adenine(1518)-N(6)/adenine(1519)-N(6))-dimethyltransferase RsmA [Candidatus Brocadiia bacterium]
MSARQNSEHPKPILQRLGIRPRRRLGQNFLISDQLLDRIVELAGVGPEDAVLEIGTGLGRLTARLADRARAVVSVEIDPGLYAAALDRLAGLENVTLVNADFLARKHLINPEVERALRQAAGDGPFKVVANLPYQISSPGIINLLEWEPQPAEIDVMLQAEVADRLTAGPGTPQYGPLTVFAAYWADVERLMKVPPSAFWPQPQVGSAFVRITPRTSKPEAAVLLGDGSAARRCKRPLTTKRLRRPPLQAAFDHKGGCTAPPGASLLKGGRTARYEVFSRVVNKLLQNRRKGLGRALEMGWGKDVAGAVLGRLGLERAIRPDQLAPGDFIRIAEAIQDAASAPE